MVKLLKIGVYDSLAAGIILCATALRVVLNALGWPPTNADEGTMGIMALHIAYRAERPLLFYGQNYMGTLEAYLGAMFFHLFGPSLFSLRLGVILLTMLFFVSIYVLTSVLYTKPLAVVTLALLSFGSIQLFSREMLATGGSTQTLLFGSLAFLGAICLSLTQRAHNMAWVRLWRMLGYAGWGAVLGLGLWSDMVVLPFFALAVLLLLVCCWRDLLWAWVFVLVGFMAGIFPLVLYNVQAASDPRASNSLITLLALFHGSTTQAPQTFAEILFGFWNTVTVSLPIATGNPFCPVQELPWLSDNVVQTSSCVLGHALWGFGYLLLLLCGLAMTLWQLRASRRVGADVPLAIMLARLAMQIAALLAIVAYAVSSAPMSWPGFHARYLVGLLMVMPVLLAPLWQVLLGSHTLKRHEVNASPVLPEEGIVVRVSSTTRDGIFSAVGDPRVYSTRSHHSRPYWKMGMGVVLGTVFAVFVLGTWLLIGEVAATQAANQREADLIHGLVSHGVAHVYTAYWSCDDMAFLSNEQIICGVIDGNLQFSHNRVPSYLAIVRSDPRSAYVLPIGSAQLSLFERKVALAPNSYRHYILSGYVVYQPV